MIKPLRHLCSYLLGLALLFIPVGGSAQDKSIKIGNIEPLSGPTAKVGQLSQNASDLAVEEINAGGGIKSLGGAKLTMIYADSEGKPEKGVAEAEHLIKKEKVNVLIGCWNSNVTLQVSAVAERHGLPFIVPISVADAITGQGHKNVFRLAPKDTWWPRDQFAFLTDIQSEFDLKLSTVALVYEEGDWGQGLSEFWQDYAKKIGLKVALDESFATTTTDFNPLAEKIKKTNPDVLLLAFTPEEAPRLMKALSEKEVRPKVILSSGAGSVDPAFLVDTSQTAKFLFDITEWQADINRPGVKELAEKFKAKFGQDLTAEAVDSYVAIHVLADALERAGSLEPAKLRHALATTKLTNGPAMVVSYGAIEFDKTGQNQNARLIVVQFNDLGQGFERVTVWPKSVRRAGYTPVFSK